MWLAPLPAVFPPNARTVTGRDVLEMERNGQTWKKVTNRHYKKEIVKSQRKWLPEKTNKPLSNLSSCDTWLQFPSQDSPWPVTQHLPHVAWRPKYQSQRKPVLRKQRNSFIISMYMQKHAWNFNFSKHQWRRNKLKIYLLETSVTSKYPSGLCALKWRGSSSSFVIWSSLFGTVESGTKRTTCAVVGRQRGGTVSSETSLSKEFTLRSEWEIKTA